MDVEFLIDMLQKQAAEIAVAGLNGWGITMTEAAAALEAARKDACVSLVADIRFACGDNGKRMQPELVEYVRELAKDAWRLDWMASEARMISGWRDQGRWEMPAIQIDSTRDHCTPADLRAAIDAEYQDAIDSARKEEGK